MNTRKKGNKCSECTLTLFSPNTLSRSDVELLSKNCSEAEYSRGEMLFKQDSLTSHIIFIKTGLVKVHMRGPGGKDQILKITSPNSFLGIPTVMGDKINHYSATALEKTIACVIDIDIFRHFISRNGRFAHRIIHSVCSDELALFHRFVNQAQKHLHGRVADAILYFSNEIYQEDEFNLPLTRSDLGDLTGTSRESVTRTLSEFKNEGIISINGKNLTILRKDFLIYISERG